MIKREKIDGSPYRVILTALITNDKFIELFAEKNDSSFFTVKFAAKLASWCLEFYKQFETAPKSHITEILDEKVRTTRIDEDELKLIEDLLHSLNNVYENNDLNLDYLVDQLNNINRKQDLELLKTEIELALESKEYSKAETLVQEFQVFEEDSEDDNEDPDKFLEDEDVEKAIFSSSKEPLICYPSAFGEMINNAIIPNSLVAIRMAPGTGKTWQLVDFLVRACISRLNIAYFQTGDLSKGQTYERMILSMSGIPRRPLKKDHKKPVIDCIRNQEDSCELNNRVSTGCVLDAEGNLLPEDQRPKWYKPCNRCHKLGIKFPLTTYLVPDYTEETMSPETVRKWRKIFKTRMRGKKLYSKIYANDTVHVAKINKLLKKWQKEDGFKPDIILIDYADIMAPEPGSESEERKIIDKRYKKLRQLGQIWNASVVVAEQKKPEEFDSKIGTMKGFTGSSDKNKHITDGFSFQQMEGDKKRKILRCNAYKRRDEEFDMNDDVIILQDLNRGIFHLDSYWARDEFKRPVKDEKKSRKRRY